MGRHFWEHPVYRRHLRRADAILGYALSELIHEGPGEQLTQTEYAQPALLVVATGAYRVLQADTRLKPAAVAGHSLGEYSALVAAEVLRFEDALQLVQLRGREMQRACEQAPGAMAALLKIERDEVEALCADEDEVVIANYNSPQQLVISGHADAVARICSQVKANKRGRAVPLKVSGAFHSPLMKSAHQVLAAAIDETPFGRADVPVVLNVTAQATRKADEIKRALCQQMLSPVRWQESVGTLTGLGSARFVEPGPATLGKLIQQSCPQAETLTLQDLKGVHALRSA